MPGAEPIKLQGNQTCVLLLHGGGGGCTADLKEISHYLHEKGGYSIETPLLPGFGTKPEDLLNIKIQDWIDFVQEEVSLLTSKYEKLFLFGHSMGSVLAAIMAERNDLTGLMLSSAPLKLRPLYQIGSRLIPLLKIFGFKFLKRDIEGLKQKSNGVWVGYDRVAVDQGTRMLRLMKIMKRDLNKITAPTCIICGREDNDISLKSPEQLYQRISSEVKELHWIKDADHAIMFHENKTELFQITLDFINKIEK